MVRIKAHGTVLQPARYSRGNKMLAVAILVSSVVLGITLTSSHHNLHGGSCTSFAEPAVVQNRTRRQFIGHLHSVFPFALSKPQPCRAGEAIASASKSVDTVVFPGAILKSLSDTRQYRALTLPNGLRALLISDADATTCAAALSVHVGFYSDPDQVPGLAHFCEHMLFLGTREYPEENSFKRFLSANGGSQNAFTGETDTTYFFDASPGSLQEALKRFSSFFKDPLFTESGVERELNAIESEDAKNRQSDGFRISQLIKSFAADGHPQRHFGTGNRQTLLVEPSKRGIRPRDELLKLFKLYNAGLMSVCVIGRDPLETLQTWVEDSFSGIHGSSDAVNPASLWQG